MKCVYQKNIKDCGVACLLMIIRYYGGDNTYENLRRMTRCDNNGISALNIIKAANKLGFNSKGFYSSYDDLNNIVLPCICHVVLENGYTHYVVLTKIEKGCVYISDPAYGNKKYSKEEFLKLWDNIVIELVKEKNISNIKYKNTMIKDIIKNNIWLYLLITIYSFFSILFMLLNNYYFKLVIDYKNLKYIFIIFIVIITFKEISEYIRNNLLAKLEINTEKSLNIYTHSKLLSLPYYYFNTRNSGDIITKINDLCYIRDLLVKVPVFILVDASFLIISTVILLNINVNLFIIFILICSVYVLILFAFNNKSKKLILTSQQLNEISNSLLVENVKGISTIKNLNLINYRNSIYSDNYNLYLQNKYCYERLYNKETILKDLILFVGINFILSVGISYVQLNIINLSDLVLFNSLMLYFIDPLKNLCELNPIIKYGKTALNRVDEIYEISNCYFDTKPQSYDIFIKNLNFSYDGYSNILENINLNIYENDKVIVTGQSGSGKSTLFKIVSKLYDVDNKMVFIGNNDVNFLDTSGFISYISQEEILFNDTLYNNLVLDNQYSNLDDIIKITKLDILMKNRNLSLNTIIEEEGSNLSKGERQKIILARTLLKSSKILILDEALSGVSEDEEYEIIGKILDYNKDNTIIYITHTKNCINLFQKIINIEKGKIYEKIN